MSDDKKETIKLSNFAPRSKNLEIDKAIKLRQDKVVQDTMIMQKVNHAHREAFKTRFPGQIEHCMRLTAERLQALLTSKPENMTETMTWDGKPDELLALSHALYYLSIMNQHYPVESE
jgi:hypothetical protein